MEFYTSYIEKRPVRLSEATRRYAWDSLDGKYGKETMETLGITLDDLPPDLTETQKHNESIRRIAAQAPIRICEAERISGSATLGHAISNNIPATINGHCPWVGLSHTTPGFADVLAMGMNAVEAKIIGRLSRPATPSQQEMLESVKNAAQAMRLWHGRYLEALKDTKPDTYQLLLRVPFEPPRGFAEAVQGLWFLFAFTRLCGNFFALGRVDEMLGGYLKKDLDEGKITMDEARELLASFFIKGCEWIGSGIFPDNGDAHHFQNIILAGIDARGNEITNDVTYLILDIVEEFGIGEFPIGVRINENSPEKLLTRLAEVLRHGGGVIALYNEPLVIDAMTGFGYPLEEARNFTNDGCWEVQVPGKTYFMYDTFDSVQTFLHKTLKTSSGNPASFSSMEELYQATLSDISKEVERIYASHHSLYENPEKHGWFGKKVISPTGSLFFEDCIEKGLFYLKHGPKYIVWACHIGGAPDVGNSLYAINKLVFEEQKVSFDELMHILKNNWEGYEPLRQYVLNKYTYYGNDHDESDAFTNKLFDDFADIVLKKNKTAPFLFPPGISTFGRQSIWAKHRGAVPFGKKHGDILSGNASPTPGTDTSGATAIIKSNGKTNLRKQANGMALDLKLFPSTVRGEAGTKAVVGLMKGFVTLGGFFLQIDVADAEVLRQAQQRPEEYKTLSVRVSGWNARFNTLTKVWQDMIIEQAEKGQ
jgi:formate C-acetyltransferase